MKSQEAGQIFTHVWEIKQFSKQPMHIVSSKYECGVFNTIIELTFNNNNPSIAAISIDFVDITEEGSIKCAITIRNHKGRNNKTANRILPITKTQEKLSLNTNIYKTQFNDYYGWTKDDCVEIELKASHVPLVTQQFDSKKETGYVGLKNQGATCYMNSMLEALFHLPAFRRIVYSMPTTGSEDPETSISLNLQRLFCEMQFDDRPCSTKMLTKSFGWGDLETIMMHDVQEFNRVLLDNLEKKMKGTDLQNSISDLFRGRFRSYIRCINVNYESSNIEEFYDLSLVVKDVSSLEESFEKYVEVERLCDDNQYETPNDGKQDAEMGFEFVEFPNVLHLHLRRFEYDYELDSMNKINDRFEFPKEIDLSKFLAKNADHTKSNIFELYGVLVHFGNVIAGHYYAYLKTSTDQQWYEFDDENVTKTTAEKAIDDNFGGKIETTHYGYRRSSQKTYSAYMLIYVRKDEAPAIYESVPNETVPKHLRDYVQHVKIAREQKKSLRDSESKMVQFALMTESDIEESTLMGLGGFEIRDTFVNIKVGRNITLQDLYQEVSSKLGIENIRIWLTYSYYGSPEKVLENRDSKIVSDVIFAHIPTATLFVQRIQEGEAVLIPKTHSMFFLKFYFPHTKAPLQYIGTMIFDKNESLSDIATKVCTKVGIPTDLSLNIYQEALNHTLRELPDNASKVSIIEKNSVLIFEVANETEFHFEFSIRDPVPAPITDKKDDDEKVENDVEPIEFTPPIHSIIDYYNQKYNSTTVNLYDYNSPKSPACAIKFPSTVKFSTLYEYIAKALKLDYNPDEDCIVLYKKDIYHDRPSSTPINTKHYINIQYLISGSYENEAKRPRVYYQFYKGITEMQFQQMSSIKTVFSQDGVHPTLETNILVNRRASTSEILDALRKIIDIGNGPFRITELSTTRWSIMNKNSTLDVINSKIRIDVIPEDKVEITDDTKLIIINESKVSEWKQFKNIVPPFLFEIHPNETFKDIKERLTPLLSKPNTQFLIGLYEGRTHAKKQVSDDLILYDLASDDSYLMLYAIVPGSGSSTDQAVKIYN